MNDAYDFGLQTRMTHTDRERRRVLAYATRENERLIQEYKSKFPSRTTTITKSAMPGQNS